MNCEEAKILLAPHILGDLDNEPTRCKELQAHLLCCPNCAEMYDGFKETIGFVLEHKAEFAQAFENAGAREQKIDIPIPSTASFPKIRKILIKASAVAACLVIGVFILLVFSHYSKPDTFPRTSSSEQVASVLKPSVKVELVRPSGNIVVATGQKIVADNELKTLLINGKHRMVMNTYTALAVEPLLKHGNIGCLVKLDSGQIYTHVQYDGNPFIVGTAHGRAMITGTIFDVKARNDSTTLVVSEGVVQFGSENGVVNVTAGQKSKIVGQSVPSIPLLCNTAELTAWATGYKPGYILAQAKPAQEAYDITDFSLFVTPEPIDLESLDYDEFVENKRKWFKTQFPWIFELKKVLNDKGIDIDYPELLIETGDVWQIVYPERAYRIIPVVDPNALLTVVEEYELGNSVYTQILLSANECQRPGHDMTFSTLALEKWLADCRRIRSSCFGNKNLDALWEYSQAIGRYLENTRSVLWLCIQNDTLKVPVEYKSDMLELLQKQVMTAYRCKATMVRHLNLNTSSFNECLIDDNMLSRLMGDIDEMTACEKMITQYRQ